MAIEQGFIFKFAQHHEFISSFWNVGENGHSTSTVLGLTTQKSNSQPQNGRHGLFIPFQPLIEWCFNWMCSFHTQKNYLKRELQRPLKRTSHGTMGKRKNMDQFWRKSQRRRLSMSSENSQAKPKVHQVFHPRIWKKWGNPYLPTWLKSSHWYYKGKDSFQKHG